MTTPGPVLVEMQRVRDEMNGLVMTELTGLVATLRLENAALRKALAEKEQGTATAESEPSGPPDSG